MIRKFVNRQEELDILAKVTGKPVLVIVYGRRRVGKTELLKKFCAGRDCLYFLADKRGTAHNVRRMALLTAEHFQEAEPRVEGFDGLFAFIARKAGGRLIVIIDEFSYLVEKDDSIPSVFQLIVDEVLINAPVMLVLCGSSVSMMERLLGERSPLYGRRTTHLKVNPLPLREVGKFFPGKGIEELIQAYAVTGGTPYYCSLFDPSKGVFENIRDVLLSKAGKLYEEMEFLLREEFREPGVYESLLEAMATGLASLTKIANHAGMNAKDAGSYLKTLVNLRIVRKEKPVTETARTHHRYVIDDHFFRFWFRTIHSNRSLLEGGGAATVLGRIRQDFPAYVGRHVFEGVCKEFVKSLCQAGKLPPFSPLGRWWEKDKEIDIVGIEPESRSILFAECKWQEQVDARLLLAELREKALWVNWHRGERKEWFVVCAKSFKGRVQEMQEERVLLIDLKAMERILLASPK